MQKEKSIQINRSAKEGPARQKKDIADFLVKRDLLYDLLLYGHPEFVKGNAVALIGNDSVQEAASKDPELEVLFKDYKSLITDFTQDYLYLIDKTLGVKHKNKPYTDDLRQQLFFGLIRGLELYQEEEGTKVETFLANKLNMSLKSFIRDEIGSPSGLTGMMNTARRAHTLTNVFEVMTNRLGRFPTDHELQSETEYRNNAFQNARIFNKSRGNPVVSIYSEVNPTDGYSLVSDVKEYIDILPNNDDPIDDIAVVNAMFDEFKIFLEKHHTLFSDDELLVLHLKRRGESPSDIGRSLGITGSRVSQIEQTAKVKIRALIHFKFGYDLNVSGNELDTDSRHRMSTFTMWAEEFSGNSIREIKLSAGLTELEARLYQIQSHQGIYNLKVVSYILGVSLREIKATSRSLITKLKKFTDTNSASKETTTH